MERSEFRHVDSPGSGTIVLSKDITDVKGQAYAKWALTIAATGGYNVLLYGPPGTGKSMLAERFIGLLPDLSIEQALEVAAIASVGNDGINIHNWLGRPYRSPHHSASAVAKLRPAKFHSRIMVYCFWMNFLSSMKRYWKIYASRWNQVRSVSLERPTGQPVQRILY